MSRGICIYYQLKREEGSKLVYGYSGVDLNKEYDKNKILSYDGEFEISKNALIRKDVLDAFKDQDIMFSKESAYEWHHEKVKNGEDYIGFFAMKAVFKIFNQYKTLQYIEEKGAVAY